MHYVVVPLTALSLYMHILQVVMDGSQGQRTFTGGATVKLMAVSKKAYRVLCLSKEVM